jgi:tetratricopeptide (TPR) repeat protein
MPNGIPELTFNITRRDAGGYRLDLRFFQPESESEVDPDAGQELTVEFDLDALHVLAEDPAAYGRKLSQALFAPPAARQAMIQAQTVANTLGQPLRVRLQTTPDASELHNLHWETLYDPDGKAPLFTGEKVLFSRYLTSAAWESVKLKPKRHLRALVAISNPSDLDVYSLEPVDVAGETARAKKALGEVETDVLNASEDGEHVTLEAILGRLRQGNHDILYIVAHGMARKDDSYLWLENENGETQRVSGSQLAAEFQKMNQPPVLVALLACESAGKAASQALTGIGPRLAEAGVPAVLAMQDKISVETGSRFMETFFEELEQDGVLDQAAAVARNDVREQPDYWIPVLYTFLKSAAIYGEPGLEEEVTREIGRLNRNVLIGIGAVLIILILMAAGGYKLFGPPPPPKKMTSGFNVAVARFMDIDENGKPIKSQDGQNIAAYMAKRLNDELKAAEITDYEVWGPTLTKAISGEDADARYAAASQRAKNINAQVLVYGVLKHAGTSSTFQPEFFVSSSGFRSNAPEITGENQLGRALFIRLPFERTAMEANNPAFVARSEALNLITQGLTFYARDNFTKAMEYFQQALNLDTWLDDAGREVAYLLMGNAVARQASRTLDLTNVPQAIEDYDQALTIQKDFYGTVYGRALAGKAGAIYMQAFKDTQNAPTPETIDPAKLDEAEQIFQQVLSLNDQPESSKLPQKAAIGLGQVYQARAIVEPEAGWLDKAQQQYQSVVDSYLASIEAEKAQRTQSRSKDDSPILGDLTLRELASFAYARLALIEVQRENYAQAIDLYNQSIAIATPYWEAKYSTDLSLIYAQEAIEALGAGDTAKAKELIAQAIQQETKGRDLAANLPDNQLVIEALNLHKNLTDLQNQIAGN